MPEIRSDKWFYANTAAGFLEDTKKEGYIPELLHKRFEEMWGREPSLSLLHSWEVSPLAIADALTKGHVKRDEVVILEYCLDANHRIDALVCGYEKDQPTVVLIETKQWNELPIRESDIQDYLEMKFNHGWIEVEHPSAQVMRYRNKMHGILNGDSAGSVDIRLIPYSFLHNCYELSKDQLRVLRGEKFGNLFDQVPIYTSKFSKALGNRIHERTRDQKGEEVLRMLGDF